MRVLLTNDDGPPNDTYSPYIANFVNVLKKLTDWEIVVLVPEQQRSWIGKAHIIGENVDAQVRKFPELTGDQDWHLLKGTPASCANIGVKHFGPFDLVLSGPNYGRNTSAAYIMSSGTVGACIESVTCGVPSIALSYSYTQPKHPEDHITKGSEMAVTLVKYLLDHWNKDVQIYSVNIPLFDGLSLKDTPIRYTPILQNVWNEVFTKDSPTKFKWAPNYDKVDEGVMASGQGSDAWVVMHNEVSVSPIRAVYQGVDVGAKEIKLFE